jgi:predicted TIM-barrel fold metal-dependent hydrolase
MAADSPDQAGHAPRGLDEHPGAGPGPEHGEALAFGADALLDDFTPLGVAVDLAFPLVHVDANIVHGWPLPFCGVDRGVLLWGNVCHHVKREASRFIPSDLVIGRAVCDWLGWRQRRREDMLIVDAQIHLWNAGNPTSATHRQVPAYLKDDALKEMDAGGVDAALLTPHTPWDPNANELAIEAARQHPDRFAILGNFPLDKPESRALVDTWKQRPGMLGCRFTFPPPHQSKWPTDGTIDWLWPAAERAGLPIALMAANFLPKVGEVAQRHPNLKLILDHLGRPSGVTSPSERWANLQEVLALAKYPNVAMKATGAPSYSDQPYPFRDIHDKLRQLYDAFGPARWFWGTDITRMPCPWRQCVTLFTEELPWLRGRDLELVMGRAVCDWIGWKR